MSGEGGDRIPTNEEILEDLTRDLHQAQINHDSTNCQEVTAESKSPTIPQDFDKEDNQEENTNEIHQQFDEEDTDDESLKNQDLDLTDEEKELKRKEALALKDRGNQEFKADQFQDSINTYTEALSVCPLKFNKERSILYANRAASKIKLDNKTSAIVDCTKAIKLDETYVRAYLRRAKLYEEADKLDESLDDYKKIQELNPGNNDARSALIRLPPLIEERNEKLKTEMMGKLKDLGNLFLRPFGLSTNNFQLNKDPTSGGYSVNFQQNPNNN